MFKKNGDVRLCIDARKLNSQIIPDRKRPTPIDEIRMRFKQVNYISSIDLRSGYWQVPLEEKSRDSCSFLFNGRNYSFKRMPFGLNVSESEFQKSMDFVLGPAVSHFVIIYVDVIIIMSGSLDNHCKHLKKVFGRFRKHNVTINLYKSRSSSRR